MKLIPDNIDFSAYEAMTQFKATVRKASSFFDRLVKTFPKPGEVSPHPSMFSTKLRDRLRFPPGGTTAWAGYSGHRKSTFTGQVALDLAVQGERVLLVSLEMLPEMTLHRMARQAAGKARPDDWQLERFNRWSDDRLWLFDHRGRITPEHSAAVLRYFAEEHRGTQAIIDSMMMVCTSEEHLDEQKQFATDVVRIAQESGLHVHVVAHCRKPASGAEDKPPTKHDLRGSASITDQLDNVVTIWANKPKIRKLELGATEGELLNDPDSAVTVEKARNGPWEGRCKLWFDQASLRHVDDATSRVEPYRFMQED